jgi:hypothetical protein
MEIKQMLDYFDKSHPELTQSMVNLENMKGNELRRVK